MYVGNYSKGVRDYYIILFTPVKTEIFHLKGQNTHLDYMCVAIYIYMYVYIYTHTRVYIYI